MNWHRSYSYFAHGDMNGPKYFEGTGAAMTVPLPPFSRCFWKKIITTANELIKSTGIFLICVRIRNKNYYQNKKDKYFIFVL